MNRLRLALSSILVAAGMSLIALPAQAADLAGSSWRPVSLPGARPVPRQEISFDRDRVHGSDGCNRFNGSYRQSGRSGLRFGMLMSTKMACLSPQIDNASRAFTTVLQETRGWRVRGARLYLLDSRGRQIAVFKR